MRHTCVHHMVPKSCMLNTVINFTLKFVFQISNEILFVKIQKFGISEYVIQKWAMIS